MGNGVALKNMISSILVTSMLLACGGSPSVAQGIPVTGNPQVAPVENTPETINGIAVPPDPGAAKDATLAGVDTDGNGIRDEIDRWIATKYGDKPGVLEPVRMEARIRQKFLTAKPTNQVEALAVVYPIFDVGDCIESPLKREGVDMIEFSDESMARAFNTRARIDARKQIYSLAGMISRNINDMSISCSDLK